ncbi:MAG: hypothetical protein RMK18_09910 [Armatimonadota bacterium]|nr:hypothetical protein [Armatimonadota bacterium]MCX7777993.1 hypothetical protein [Armatimonadota bacterium]MDW8026158.1 hypothetical protein [Armatimonadota bacterium]
MKIEVGRRVQLPSVEARKLRSHLEECKLKRHRDIASVTFIPALFIFLVGVAVTHSQLLQVEWQHEFGGLPQLVRLKNVEAPIIKAARIYTDWGILRPGRYDAVGSHNESSPKVIKKVGKSNDREVIIVESVGQLKDVHKQPCGLSYRFVCSIDGASLLIDALLCAEKDFDAMHGFLALVFPFIGATEWFALTESGWLFCDITKSGRVFQSSQTPLSSQRLFGIANSRTGYCVILRMIECHPEESVDNVIIHTGTDGSGGIFIAWCDGITSRAMSKGESWRIHLEVQFVSLSGFESIAEAHRTHHKLSCRSPMQNIVARTTTKLM